MAEDQFTRTRLLLGQSGLDRLHNAHVAVFGIGGVGGHVCDALVRSGVMAIDLFDNDVVSVTNINRQLVARHSTIGRAKVEVMAEHLHDISPDCAVTCHQLFYLPENADSIDLSQYDYVVDAIDTVSAKMELITRCDALKIPIITALGAGNKLHPEMLRIADIHETSVCPLARVIRLECRKRGIRHLQVVYSTEPALQPAGSPDELTEQIEKSGRRSVPGSTAFVPSTMGLMIASAVIRGLCGL